MANILNLADFVRVKVEHVQLAQILEVLDLLNIVLSKHEDSKGRDSVQVADVLDLIVIEVEED